MGTWGTKPFDNDQSSDFAQSVAESGDWTRVRRALWITANSPLLPMIFRERGVAAVGIVAAKRSNRSEVAKHFQALLIGSEESFVINGKTGEQMLIPPHPGFVDRLSAPDDQTVSLARRALTRLFTTNKATAGFKEPSLFQEWQQNLNDLKRVLS